MKEWLKDKIDDLIYKIVYDDDKSVTQKVWEISEYFDRYNWKRYHPSQNTFRKPDPKSIRHMIYDCYKLEDLADTNIFDRPVNYIVEIIISELQEKLINT